jgi:hypothetical protein
MPELTRKVVNLYIDSAEAFATTQSERELIRLAAELNSVPQGWKLPGSKPPKRLYRRTGEARDAGVDRVRSKAGKGFYVGDIWASAERPPDGISLPDATTSSWLRLSRREIHIALCTRSARYRKYVDAIDQNFNLLIGVVAIAVAGKIGMAVTVVSSLVAALLRLIMKMGVAVFCKSYAAG